MKYRALVTALAPEYDFGDWFLIPDQATGYTGKVGPRPWLLRERLDRAKPRTRLLPRSTTGYEGVVHGAHPQDRPHGPCRVNAPGRIVRTFGRTLATTAVTAERFGCREPDIVALKAVLT